MLLYWQNGDLQFTTDVEDWMTDLEFTEVFRYSGEPSALEMEITCELDHILHEVRFGADGVRDTLKKMTESDVKLVLGKKSKRGVQSLGSAEGSAVDAVFKDRLDNALKGRLKRWAHLIETTGGGKRGVDVISRPLGVGWDVTTVNDVWNHVQRDVFGKAGKTKRRLSEIWDRYYILVWDEPRTERSRKTAAIEEGILRGQNDR